MPPRSMLLRYATTVLALAGLGIACSGTDGGSEPTDSGEVATPEIQSGKADHLEEMIDGRLDYGEAVTGRFSHDLEFHGYRFSGEPGGVVSVDNTNEGTSRNLDSTLFLYARRDGTWERVAFDDDSGWGEHAAIRDYELPQSEGSYLAVLGTAESRDRGDFRLELTCENDQCESEAEYEQTPVSDALKNATRDLSDEGIFHRSGIEAYSYEGTSPSIESLTDAMIEKQDEPSEWTREEPLANLDELAFQLDSESYPEMLRTDLGSDDASAEIGSASNPEPGMYDAAYTLYVVHFPEANKVYNVNVLYVD